MEPLSTSQLKVIHQSTCYYHQDLYCCTLRPLSREGRLRMQHTTLLVKAWRHNVNRLPFTAMHRPRAIEPSIFRVTAVSARHPAGGRVQLRRGAAGCSLLCCITGWEGVGTERVTTNLRGNAARQGEGLSVVQHRTGDEIAAQTQSEAPALWVIALENH